MTQAQLTLDSIITSEGLVYPFIRTRSDSIDGASIGRLPAAALSELGASRDGDDLVLRVAGSETRVVGYFRIYPNAVQDLNETMRNQAEQAAVVTAGGEDGGGDSSGSFFDDHPLGLLDQVLVRSTLDLNQVVAVQPIYSSSAAALQSASYFSSLGALVDASRIFVFMQKFDYMISTMTVHVYGDGSRDGILRTGGLVRDIYIHDGVSIWIDSGTGMDSVTGSALDDTINLMAKQVGSKITLGGGKDVLSLLSGGEAFISVGAGSTAIKVGDVARLTLDIAAGAPVALDLTSGSVVVTTDSAMLTVGATGAVVLALAGGSNIVDLTGDGVVATITATGGTTLVTGTNGDDRITVALGGFNDLLDLKDGDDVLTIQDGGGYEVRSFLGEHDVINLLGSTALRLGDLDATVNVGASGSSVTLISNFVSDGVARDIGIPTGLTVTSVINGAGDTTVDATQVQVNLTAKGVVSVGLGSGNDTVTLDPSAAANISITDAGGSNQLFATPYDDTVAYNLASGTLTGHLLGGNDVFIGSGAGAMTIYGDGGNNTITTGSGNDTIYAGVGGNNVVRAGAGDDRIVINPLDGPFDGTVYDGGVGIDTAYGEGTGFADLSKATLTSIERLDLEGSGPLNIGLTVTQLDGFTQIVGNSVGGDTVTLMSSGTVRFGGKDYKGIENLATGPQGNTLLFGKGVPMFDSISGGKGDDRLGVDGAGTLDLTKTKLTGIDGFTYDKTGQTILLNAGDVTKQTIYATGAPDATLQIKGSKADVTGLINIGKLGTLESVTMDGRLYIAPSQANAVQTIKMTGANTFVNLVSDDAVLDMGADDFVGVVNLETDATTSNRILLGVGTPQIANIFGLGSNDTLQVGQTGQISDISGINVQSFENLVFVAPNSGIKTSNTQFGAEFKVSIDATPVGSTLEVVGTGTVDLAGRSMIGALASLTLSGGAQELYVAPTQANLIMIFNGSGADRVHFVSNDASVDFRTDIFTGFIEALTDAATGNTFVLDAGIPAFATLTGQGAAANNFLSAGVAGGTSDVSTIAISGFGGLKYDVAGATFQASQAQFAANFATIDGSIGGASLSIVGAGIVDLSTRTGAGTLNSVVLDGANQDLYVNPSDANATKNFDGGAGANRVFLVTNDQPLDLRVTNFTNFASLDTDAAAVGGEKIILDAGSPEIMILNSNAVGDTLSVGVAGLSDLSGSTITGFTGLGSEVAGASVKVTQAQLASQFTNFAITAGGFTLNVDGAGVIDLASRTGNPGAMTGVVATTGIHTFVLTPVLANTIQNFTGTGADIAQFSTDNDIIRFSLTNFVGFATLATDAATSNRVGLDGVPEILNLVGNGANDQLLAGSANSDIRTATVAGFETFGFWQDNSILIALNSQANAPVTISGTGFLNSTLRVFADVLDVSYDISAKTVSNLTNLQLRGGNDTLTATLAQVNSMSSIDGDGVGVDTITLTTGGSWDLRTSVVTNFETLNTSNNATDLIIGPGVLPFATISGGTAIDRIDFRGVGGTLDLSPTFMSSVDRIQLTDANQTVNLTVAQIAMAQLELNSTNAGVTMADAGIVNLDTQVLSGTLKRFVGTAGVDTVILSPTQFQNLDTINLGAGADAITLSTSGAFDLTNTVVTGVETLNLANNVVQMGLGVVPFLFINGGAGADGLSAINAGVTDISAATLTSIETLRLGVDNAHLIANNAQVQAATFVAVNTGDTTLELTTGGVLGLDTRLSGAALTRLTLSGAGDDVFMTAQQVSDLTNFVGGAGVNNLTVVDAGTANILGDSFIGLTKLTGAAAGLTLQVGTTQLDFDVALTGAASDTVSFTGAGAVDVSGRTFTGVRTVLGDASDQAVTMTVAQAATLQTLNMGGGVNSLTLSNMGTLDFAGVAVTNLQDFNYSAAGNKLIVGPATNVVNYNGGAGVDTLGLNGVVDISTSVISSVENLTFESNSSGVILTVAQYGSVLPAISPNGFTNLSVRAVDGGTLDARTLSNAFASVTGSASGNTFIAAAGSTITFNGDVANDIYNIASNVAINDLGGTDLVELNFGGAFVAYTLQAGLENATILAGAGSIQGNASNNVLTGGAGADTFFISNGGGVDTIVGGGGIDALDFVNGPSGAVTSDVTVDFVAQTFSYATGSGTAAAMSSVITGVGNDTVTLATGAGSTVSTGGGADIIQIAAGVSLAGGTIDGGAGVDQLRFTGTGVSDLNGVALTGVESLTGDAGDQTVQVTQAQLTSFGTVNLGAGTNKLVLTTAGAVDLTAMAISNVSELQYAAAGNVITIGPAISISSYIGGAALTDGLILNGVVNLSTSVVSQIETLSFGANASGAILTNAQFTSLLPGISEGGFTGLTLESVDAGLLDASSLSAAFVSVKGSDFGNTFTTGAGQTIALIGGTSNDIYNISSSGITITDAGGTDTVNMTAGVGFTDYTLAAGLENLNLLAGPMIGTMRLTANAGDNIITAAHPNDTYFVLGQGGNDTVKGSTNASTASYYVIGDGSGTVDVQGGVGASQNILDFANFVGGATATTSNVTLDFAAGTFATGSVTGTLSNVERAYLGGGADVVTIAASTLQVETGAGDDEIRMAAGTVLTGKSFVMGAGAADKITVTGTGIIDFAGAGLTGIEFFTGDLGDQTLKATLAQTTAFTGGFDFGGGTDTLDIQNAGTLDLTTLSVNNLEVLKFNAAGNVVKIGPSVAIGTYLGGASASDELILAGGIVDLTGSTLSSVEKMSFGSIAAGAKVTQAQFASLASSISDGGFTGLTFDVTTGGVIDARYLGAGIDSIKGSNAGNSYLWEPTNSVKLYAGSGADTFDMYASPTVVDGGAGFDIANINFGSHNNVNASMMLIRASNASPFFSNIEQFNLSGLNADYFTGTTGAETINGSGSDIRLIASLAGNDIVTGGTGVDTIFAIRDGDGSDTFTGNAVSKATIDLRAVTHILVGTNYLNSGVTTNAEFTVASGGSGSVVIAGETSNFTNIREIRSGSGADTFSLDVNYNPTGMTLLGGTGIDTIKITGTGTINLTPASYSEFERLEGDGGDQTWATTVAQVTGFSAGLDFGAGTDSLELTSTGNLNLITAPVQNLETLIFSGGMSNTITLGSGTTVSKYQGSASVNDNLVLGAGVVDFTGSVLDQIDSVKFGANAVGVKVTQSQFATLVPTISDGGFTSLTAEVTTGGVINFSTLSNSFLSVKGSSSGNTFINTNAASTIQMIGQSGNDIYQMSTNAAITDSGGTDTVIIDFQGAAGTYTLAAGLENLSAVDRFTTLYGNASDNIIQQLYVGAGTSFSVLRGFAGNDTMIGSTEVDTFEIYDNDGVDTVDGKAAASGSDAVNFYTTAAVTADVILGTATYATGSVSFQNIESIGFSGANDVARVQNDFRISFGLGADTLNVVSGGTFTAASQFAAGNGGIDIDTFNIEGSAFTDFSLASITQFEALVGDAADQDIKMTVAQIQSFGSLGAAIDLGVGNDTLAIADAGALDISGVTVSNIETLQFAAGGNTLSVGAGVVIGHYKGGAGVDTIQIKSGIFDLSGSTTTLIDGLAFAANNTGVKLTQAQSATLLASITAGAFTNLSLEIADAGPINTTLLPSNFSTVIGSNAGNTFLTNAATSMTLKGGTGADIYGIANLTTTIVDAGGTDQANLTFAGGFTSYTMAAGMENAAIVSGAGTITANSVSNVITLGAGADILIQTDNGGTDTLDGGAGFDALNLRFITSGPASVDFSANTYVAGTGSGTHINFERAQGSDSVATTFTDGAGAQNIVGGSANNNIVNVVTGGADNIQMQIGGDNVFNITAGISMVGATYLGTAFSNNDRINVVGTGSLNFSTATSIGNFFSITGDAGDQVVSGVRSFYAGMTNGINLGGGTDTLAWTDAGLADFSMVAISNVETIQGSTGADTFLISTLSGVTAINLQGGADEIRTTKAVDFSAATLTSVEGFRFGGGSAADNVITMTTAQATGFTSGFSNSSVFATTLALSDAGTHDLSGVLGLSSNVSRILGNAGNETFVTPVGGLSFAGIVDGGAGDDVYSITANTQYAGANLKYTISEGVGAGTDTVRLAAAVTNSTDLSTTTNIEVLDASLTNFNGVLTGSNTFGMTISGSIGNDSIFTGSGNDIVSSNAGNDLVNIRNTSGVDTLDGGAGTNTLSLAAVTSDSTITFTANGEGSFLHGSGSGTFKNFTNAVGGIAKDTFDGFDVSGPVTITGGSGNDRYLLSASDTATISITDFTRGDIFQHQDFTLGTVAYDVAVNAIIAGQGTSGADRSFTIGGSTVNVTGLGRNLDLGDFGGTRWTFAASSSAAEGGTESWSATRDTGFWNTSYVASVNGTFSMTTPGYTVGGELTAASGTVTLGIGASSANLTVGVQDNNIWNNAGASRNGLVTWSGQSSGVLGSATSALVITENDAAPTVSISSAGGISEGGTQFVTLTLDRASDTAISGSVNAAAMDARFGGSTTGWTIAAGALSTTISIGSVTNDAFFNLATGITTTNTVSTGGVSGSGGSVFTNIGDTEGATVVTISGPGSVTEGGMLSLNLITSGALADHAITGTVFSDGTNTTGRFGDQSNGFSIAAFSGSTSLNLSTTNDAFINMRAAGNTDAGTISSSITSISGASSAGATVNTTLADNESVTDVRGNAQWSAGALLGTVIAITAGQAISIAYAITSGPLPEPGTGSVRFATYPADTPMWQIPPNVSGDQQLAVNGLTNNSWVQSSNTLIIPDVTGIFANVGSTSTYLSEYTYTSAAAGVVFTTGVIGGGSNAYLSAALTLNYANFQGIRQSTEESEQALISYLESTGADISSLVNHTPILGLRPAESEINTKFFLSDLDPSVAIGVTSALQVWSTATGLTLEVVNDVRLADVVVDGNYAHYVGVVGADADKLPVSTTVALDRHQSLISVNNGLMATYGLEPGQAGYYALLQEIGQVVAGITDAASLTLGDQDGLHEQSVFDNFLEGVEFADLDGIEFLRDPSARDVALFHESIALAYGSQGIGAAENDPARNALIIATAELAAGSHNAYLVDPANPTKTIANPEIALGLSMVEHSNGSLAVDPTDPTHTIASDAAVASVPATTLSSEISGDSTVIHDASTISLSVPDVVHLTASTASAVSLVAAVFSDPVVAAPAPITIADAISSMSVPTVTDVTAPVATASEVIQVILATTPEPIITPVQLPPILPIDIEFPALLHA
jgi:hypothetical protein